MKARHLIHAALALTAVVLVAGCGGDDGGGDAGNGTGGEGAAESITISASEFAFEPASVTIDEPGTYTFVVENAGEAPHALAIEGPGVDEETATIEGGETAELTVEITEPGEYELVCPVDGHREQGMEGTLVLEGR